MFNWISYHRLQIYYSISRLFIAQYLLHHLILFGKLVRDIAVISWVGLFESRLTLT